MDELDAEPPVVRVDGEAFAADALVQGAEVGESPPGIGKEHEWRVESEWSLRIEGVAEYLSLGRHRGTLPTATDELAHGKVSQDELQAPDLLRVLRSGHDLQPIDGPRGPNPGTTRMLLLAARGAQTHRLQPPAPTLLDPSSLTRIQSVGVLECDDLKSETVTTEIEEGISEIEAELMHVPALR
jgi:hypothetical protein